MTNSCSSLGIPAQTLSADSCRPDPTMMKYDIISQCFHTTGSTRPTYLSMGCICIPIIKNLKMAEMCFCLQSRWTFSINPLQSAYHSINTHQSKLIKSTGAGSITLSKTCICLPCQTRDVYWYQLLLNWFFTPKRFQWKPHYPVTCLSYCECHPSARNTRNLKTSGRRRQILIQGVSRAKNNDTSLFKCELKTIVHQKWKFCHHYVIQNPYAYFEPIQYLYIITRSKSKS